MIVSEHAGRNVYEGIKNLTVVERWRRGRKLIPWHWDAEALSALNGTPADAALEDLLDSRVKPAILSTLDLPKEASLETATVEHAVFKELAIVFRIRCSLSFSDGSTGRDGSSVRREIRQTLEGTISQDLSVSIARATDS